MDVEWFAWADESGIFTYMGEDFLAPIVSIGVVIVDINTPDPFSGGLACCRYYYRFHFRLHFINLY